MIPLDKGVHVMVVTLNRKKALALIEKLVARLRSRSFPYNLDRAKVPQHLIPEHIRSDKLLLARFYFFICIYMRGGVESHTVFRQFAKLAQEHPYLFDPEYVTQHVDARELLPILRGYIGWDSRAATLFWKANAERLWNNWGGNPFHLIKNLHSYHEALRRIRRKDIIGLDPTSEGFYGFKEKMTSMLLYFYNWEGWLNDFLYPSPADFHHVRIFLATEILQVETDGTTPIRYNDALTAPIRKVTVEFMRLTGAKPVEVSDALWLFSLLLCGESPATVTSAPREELPLFPQQTIVEAVPIPTVLGRRKSALLRTCGQCPLSNQCKYGIPSGPYYKKGQLVLRPRPQTPFTWSPD